MCVTGPAGCSKGFLSLDNINDLLLSESDVFSFKQHPQEQRILSGISFTCSGSVTKWIIGAQRKPSITAVLHPDLQVWRCSVLVDKDNIDCDREGNSTISGAVQVEGHPNVYQYTPDPPLEFESGDVFGLYQPDSLTSQLEVVFEDTSPGGITIRVEGLSSPLTSISDMDNSLDIEDGGGDNDFPLITVETSKVTCTFMYDYYSSVY